MTRVMPAIFVAALIAVGFSGCTSVAPVPVPRANPFPDEPGGIPYYDGSYYLLIYADGHGNLKWSLEYIFDPAKKMIYKASATLASLETSLKFNYGLLSESTTTADSTAVPTAILGAFKTVLSAGVMNDLTSGATKVPTPRIYKVLIHGDQVELLGADDQGAPVLVRVTQRKPATPRGTVASIADEQIWQDETDPTPMADPEIEDAPGGAEGGSR